MGIIKVALAEDNVLLREGVSRLVSANEDHSSTSPACHGWRPGNRRSWPRWRRARATPRLPPPSAFLSARLVLRNVRLTAELQATIDDLRASRRRLASAQDEERQRIERNLHDGAQQQLVALMADRLAAVGGTLGIRSEPGLGTTISGRLPAGEPA